MLIFFTYHNNITPTIHLPLHATHVALYVRSRAHGTMFSTSHTPCNPLPARAMAKYSIETYKNIENHVDEKRTTGRKQEKRTNQPQTAK